MMRFFLATIAGISIGFIGIVIHNAFSPYGLLFSIVVTFTGIWLVGRFWGSRWLKIPAAFGWLAIVLKAASHGVSYEILVIGNNNGNAFLLAGFSSVVLAGLWRV
jgi:hypothetical protein